MLSETKLSLLKQLVHNASNEEIIWTKGYLAGYLDKNEIGIPVSTIAVSESISVKPLILYGTETGNSKKVASQLLANFKKNKIQAKSADVFQYDIAKLEKETHVLFVMSTQGEGEFPQNALSFYEALKSSNANLNKLSFAVFGLGDTSYPLFCNAGVLLDEVLAEKGAKRLLPLVKADVDYADDVITWENDLLKSLQNLGITTATAVSKTTTVAGHKKNYTGVISHKVILNDKGSNKETYHIEITSDDEIIYEPGDALGVVPKNKPEDVAFILDYFGVKAQEEITIKDQKNTAQIWLQERNIKGLSKRSLDQIDALFGTKTEAEKLDLIDFLKKNAKPETITLESLLSILLPIAPRLYSISSSSEAHDGQVHLTVNLNVFSIDGETKEGLASRFLADFPLDTELEFYIHKNQNFRLPDEGTDVIMIGPGTGIAPFRSFLAHRDATGADGKNWLFFGEQHFVQDFYYQTEIQEWLNTGVLSKLDTAFSRDQQKKIYVQDRIRQKSKEFNEWLENGASLYICGQKAPMSVDVENAIIEVLVKERNISETEAKQLLEEMETAGKFQKDVY
jgi:sulfite reductase (NADPH) flavoprotein alpha-component